MRSPVAASPLSSKSIIAGSNGENARTLTTGWVAALGGRLAYVIHRVAGHGVTWKTPPDPPLCSGDIVCHDCGQVLWCRAHDPWRLRGSEPPVDHWGATRPRVPRWTMFERLQDVLRLADECPAGPSGDDIRRAACELIEADSGRQRRVRRRRLMRIVARLKWVHAHDRPVDGDPSALMLKRLTDALRRPLPADEPGVRHERATERGRA